MIFKEPLIPLIDIQEILIFQISGISGSFLSYFIIKISVISGLFFLNFTSYFRDVSFYSSIIRPFLFKSDPEVIHQRVFRWIKILFKVPGIKSLCSSIFLIKNKRLNRTIFEIDFPNPVGLAAGFDKNASHMHELSAFGFGFIEVGTVTPLPQPGNFKPRMFRLQDDQALINRMGFNNDGVKSMVKLLMNPPANVIIGANIGKNKNTPNENAGDDYEICFRELFNYVHYFAVNVSSPNTPGLRSLQEKGPLLQILLRLQKINSELSSLSKGSNSHLKPVLLKIAPDLSFEQLDDIIEVVITSKLDGIIATNTTVLRENLISKHQEIDRAGAGGLSGKPLVTRSNEVIRYLSSKSENRFKIIGVGGIHTPQDAIEKLNAGADLIQIYTGFIYEGPGIVKRLNKEILKRS